MKPPAFLHRRPATLEAALGQLAAADGDGKVLAGGQSLIPLLNMRLAQPAELIDVHDVPGLRHLRLEDGGLRIGALVTHDRIARHPAPLPGFEHLRDAAGLIGHLPVRARGTFGGSLAHADPLAEWSLLSLLHDAELVCASVDGVRRIASADFVQGPFMTDLADAELVVEVLLRRRFEHASLCEQARRPGDFAVVAAAVGFDVVEGAMTGAAVAVAGAGPVQHRLPAAEAELEGRSPSVATFRRAAQAAAASVSPTPDAAGAADYRRALVAGLVEEACTAALRGSP